MGTVHHEVIRPYMVPVQGPQASHRGVGAWLGAERHSPLKRDRAQFRSLDRSMPGEGGQVLCLDLLSDPIRNRPRSLALLERYGGEG